MLFRQVLHEDLGCASYFLGSGGEAVVVDPKWEVERYLELAVLHGLRIAHVLETHTHADHVSGHGRLAAATDATLWAARDAGAEYPHEPLDDGSTLELGDVRIRALVTPGHRPEHLCFLVEDGSRADQPWLLLSGDCLFVGDVGRPDLAVEPAEGARGQYQSLRKLLELDDHVALWPAHTGGSLCGGAAMSKTPSSTIGFERRHSELLAIDDEDSFVERLTSSLQPQPPSFERIVELNRGPLLAETAPIDAIAPARVRRMLDDGTVALDARPPRDFDAAHIPGSINVTAAETGVGTRAAWVVDPESPIVVVARSRREARCFGRLLQAAGLLDVRGYLAGGAASWHEQGLPIDTTPALDVEGLAERLRGDEVVLLDVRGDDEWRDGHVHGSVHVPFYDLRDGVPDEVRDAQDGKALAVACSAGNRSSLAASLLQRAGLDRVEHVADGGVPDLAERGIPLERD